MSSPDLRSVSAHFAFGANWRSYLSTVNAQAIADAERNFARLLGGEALAGRTLLDIGCGSGMSMLAALGLGAARVNGVDIDPDSVEAARTLLGAHAMDGPWGVAEASVFDLSPEVHGLHDIVHSWGVLHHTGDMWTAIDKAAALVAPGGLFVVALYAKTPLCPLWVVEKRLYTRAPAWLRALVRVPFKAALLAGILATGRNPWRYVRDYHTARGMDFHHDIVDWLGGYPYESVSPAELVPFLANRGFDLVHSNVKRAALGGLFGSHCDEYVLRRSR